MAFVSIVYIVNLQKLSGTIPTCGSEFFSCHSYSICMYIVKHCMILKTIEYKNLFYF
jgi:hypothetical protein